MVLYRVGLVAKAQNEVAMPEVTIVLHNMKQHRLMADGDHRLGNIF